jgi:hypothetical protein
MLYPGIDPYISLYPKGYKVNIDRAYVNNR